MAATPILALHGGTPPGLRDLVRRLEDEATRRQAIRCPACAWRPGKSSEWHCQDTGAPEFFSPGCGAVWNTFDTRGRCPGCSHRWRWTSCLECHVWSPHDDWYVLEDHDPAA